MENKRGFLLAEETLKIILSVIAIGFLIYFLASLYYANKGDNEMELAQASLEHLIEEINTGVAEVVIYNPEDWEFSSWPFEEEIPDVCSNLGWVECVCICEDKGYFYEVNKCNKNGFCTESEDIIFEQGLVIEDEPLNLNINYDNNEVVVRRG